MTLTVRLPETIESQLTRFCETMGLSKSQVVQTALRDWFAKPAVSTAHPLLAFAQASAAAVPSADWAGPYSKENLRARVLASADAQQVCEPQAAYVLPQKKPATRSKALVNSTKKVKTNSIQPTSDMAGDAIGPVNMPSATGQVDGA